MNSEEFTLVTRRNRRGTRTKQGGPLINRDAHANNLRNCSGNGDAGHIETLLTANDEVVNNLHQLIALRMAEIEKSVEFSAFSELIKTHHVARLVFQHVIILGLGTFNRSRASQSQNEQYQLATFLLIKKLLLFSSQCDYVAYDPIFREMDKEVLGHYGIRVLLDSELKEYAIEHETVFFMPHCERELYESVVSTNWSSEMIHRLVIIGNSFHAYQQLYLPAKEISVLKKSKNLKKKDASDAHKTKNETLYPFLQKAIECVDEVVIFPSHELAQCPPSVSSCCFDALCGTSVLSFQKTVVCSSPHS